MWPDSVERGRSHSIWQAPVAGLFLAREAVPFFRRPKGGGRGIGFRLFARRALLFGGLPGGLGLSRQGAKPPKRGGMCLSLRLGSCKVHRQV